MRLQVGMFLIPFLHTPETTEGGPSQRGTEIKGKEIGTGIVQDDLLCKEKPSMALFIGRR
jgi:hypothetical protein